MRPLPVSLLMRFSPVPRSILVAAALATLSVCIRPTMLVFWAYYHIASVWSVYRARGFSAFATFNANAVLGGWVP